MEVAIRPKVVQHIFKILTFEATPKQNVFIRSAGLDTKISDIFWTPFIIGDPRDTENNKYGFDKFDV